MHLLRLPNEVLERIASNLNANNLAAFGMSHERLRAVAYNLTSCMKIADISTTLWQYLAVNGSAVRSLDLSHCSRSPYTMREVGQVCPNVEQLNLVNAAFSHYDVLGAIRSLARLVTLNFSVSVVHPTPYPIIRLSKLRKLYVEVVPSLNTFDFIVEMLNNCEQIEMVHISIIGRPDARQRLSNRPRILAAERWRTLSTVVCSCNLSQTERLHVSLLKRIFAAQMDESVDRWIQDEKDCFIYEHGNFNATSDDSVVNAANVKLIHQFG